MAILSAAWIGAYVIRFPDDLSFYMEASALPALPFVIAFKVTALLFFNLYRGFWRTIHFSDVIAVGKAISLATLLIVVAATVLQRFENYSRGVIAIDWLLSLIGVVGSRSAFRFLRENMARLVGRPQRAAILGPEVVKPLVEEGLREERNYELVGVVAPSVDGQPPETVLEAVRALEAEVVLVAAVLPDDDPQLVALRGAGIQVRRLAVVLE